MSRNNLAGIEMLWTGKVTLKEMSCPGRSKSVFDVDALYNPKQIGEAQEPAAAVSSEQRRPNLTSVQSAVTFVCPELRTSLFQRPHKYKSACFVFEQQLADTTEARDEIRRTYSRNSFTYKTINLLRYFSKHKRWSRFYFMGFPIFLCSPNSYFRTSVISGPLPSNSFLSRSIFFVSPSTSSISIYCFGHLHSTINSACTWHCNILNRSICYSLLNVFFYAHSFYVSFRARLHQFSLKDP